MKRIMVFLMLISVCLSLCGCGGEITGSENTASSAENETSDSIFGEWVLEFGEGGSGYSAYASKLILNDDYTFEYGKYSDGEIKVGTWKYSEDESEIIMMDSRKLFSYVITFVEEDGFLKLLCENFLYVRAEEKDAAFDKKFIRIQMNSIQYGSYLGELKFVGNPPDNWSYNPCSFYILESLMLEEGLIYVAHSENFKMTLVVEEGKISFGRSTAPFELLALERTKGETLSYTAEEMIGAIYYAREEYVADVYYEDGVRVIEMKAGYKMYDYSNRPWELIPDVDPNDFPM